MNNQAKVIKNPKSGLLVTPSKSNPEQGYVTVVQEASEFKNGFLNVVKRSALIGGKISDLTKAFTHEGQALPGKIVVKESLEPINPDNLDQGIKIAGASNIPCTVMGAPVYRTTEYTEDLTSSDTLVAHDNGDAIKAYQAKAKAEAANLG